MQENSTELSPKKTLAQQSSTTDKESIIADFSSHTTEHHYK